MILLILVILSPVIQSHNPCLQVSLPARLCTLCQPHYSLSNQGRCIPKTQHCGRIDEKGDCVSCLPAYRLNGGHCSPDHTGCIEFKQKSGQCVSCAYGTVLINGGCSGVLHCQDYKQGRCQSCMGGYRLQKGKCQNDRGDCLKINNVSGVCEECSSGFERIGLMCVPRSSLVEGCQAYDEKYECLKCSVLFYLHPPSNSCLLHQKSAKMNESRLLQATVIPQSIQHCVNYNQESCLQCQSGFASIGFSCVEAQAVFGCDIFDPSSRRCSRCGINFRLVEGKCQDLACFAKNEFSQCTECFDGFTLDTQNTGACIDEKCVQIGNGICTKCEDGFYKPDQNTPCLEINELNCVQLPSLSCTQCPLGYYFSSGCKIVPPACTMFNSQNNICVQCGDGFRIEEGQCVEDTMLNGSSNSNMNISEVSQTAIPAIEGEALSTREKNQNSLTQIQNCIVHDSFDPNLCGRCSDGYYVSPSKQSCLRISLICSTYLQTGFCLSCITGRQPIQGFCQDHNCLSPQQDSCLQCLPASTYNQELGVCERPQTNCLRINQLTQRCEMCAEGYGVNFDGYCLAMPAACVAVNYVTWECLQCQQGFTLINPYYGCVGESKAPNCQVVYQLSPDKCLICNEGYYLTQGRECMPISSSCQTGQINFSTGHCLSCPDGFYLEAVTGNCLDPHCRINGFKECLECDQRYYLRSNSICTQYVPDCRALWSQECGICPVNYQYTNGTCQPILPSNCVELNTAGDCVSCTEGYQLVNSQCITNIPNCLTFSGSICIQCQNGFVLGNRGICFYTISQCESMNLENGQCDLCNPSYALSANRTSCLPRAPSQDPNCRRFQNGFCVQCSNRYFRNSVGMCAPVHPLCKDFNTTTGACLSCYPYYQLSGTRCEPIAQPDPYCLAYEGNACSSCSQGYYISNGKCQQINPSCRTSNSSTGECLSCYEGYVLRNAGCSRSDSNCRTFNAEERCEFCVEWFYPLNGICTPVSPLCKTYNRQNGRCLTCYPGYTLNNGVCGVAPQPTNCELIQNGRCVVCYSGYYQRDGTCIEVNPLCKSSDQNGVCTSCYPGYRLLGVTCSPLTQNDTDIYCKNKTADGDCLECYEGYVVSNTKCMVRDDQCSVYNQSLGVCLACYRGYILNSQGKCARSSSTDTDLNCLEKQGGKCLKCASGFYLSVNNQCILADPLCRAVLDGGFCSQCYPGYVLSAGKCIDNRYYQVFIPFCERYQNEVRVCSKCIDRYYLSAGQCKPVSPTCGNYDHSNGVCLSCISESFDLQGGECVQLLRRVAGCSKYQGPYCVSCSAEYYFQGYTCLPIDPSCLVFDYESVQCISCAGGRRPLGAICR